jgi:hypothetical protein
MRAALLVVILLAACSSVTQDDTNAQNVALHLAQYEGAPDAYIYGGQVNVRYSLSVANRTKEPVTLTRIEIRTIGSGAYTIRPTSTQVNIDLVPGEQKNPPSLALGECPRRQPRRARTGHPRATAYMTGPAGPFVRLFTEYLSQQ